MTGADQPRTALVVIDMLNAYDHEDAEPLARSAATVVQPLARLIGRARERDDVELIWVNDNFEDFSATREDLVGRALAGRRPDLVEPVVPAEDCAFLPKVRHSAFYGTALDHHLRRRAVQRLILTGQVTEQCVLYSALDAYVRHYDLTIAHDAVAHIDPELGAAALRMVASNMRGEVLAAGEAL